jgi:hypothetical protein
MSNDRKFEFLGNTFTSKFYFLLFFVIRFAVQIGIYRRYKSADSE